MLTPICQMKDLLLGGSTTCRRGSLEPSVGGIGVGGGEGVGGGVEQGSPAQSLLL